MSGIGRFQRGNSTYRCLRCRKLTRDTEDNSGVWHAGGGLCAYCFDVEGLSNSLSDGTITPAEYEAQLSALAKQHGKLWIPTPPTSS